MRNKISGPCYSMEFNKNRNNIHLEAYHCGGPGDGGSRRAFLRAVSLDTL